MYFLYGESVVYYFKHIVLLDKVLLPFATHHRFISFMLYVIGKFALNVVVRLSMAFELKAEAHIHILPHEANNCLSGFVFFVTSLQKGHYKFQFTQFAWTHMALYLIVVQAHFVMNNIFEGMIWFFLPAALVIVNDIFAYICGMLFGRTPLIQLSPKKTLEGFLGAWVWTILFGFLFSNVLSRSTYFTCPVNVRMHSTQVSPPR
jgi:phosphatidate cytidylyltransferase